jgi:hypothetical protein
LIDSARLVSQFSTLERRAYPSGRDQVRKGPGCRDDACNSAALSLVLAASQPAPMVITADMIAQVQRAPRAVPFQARESFGLGLGYGERAMAQMRRGRY